MCPLFTNSPTVKETLHSLTDASRSQEQADEGAKLEKVNRETPSSRDVSKEVLGEMLQSEAIATDSGAGTRNSPKSKVGWAGLDAFDNR